MASSTQASLLEEVLKAIPEFLQPATFRDDGKRAFDVAFCTATDIFPGHDINDLLLTMMKSLEFPRDTMKLRGRCKIVVAIVLCADIAAPVRFAKSDSFRKYVTDKDWWGDYEEGLSPYITGSLRKLVNSAIKDGLIPCLTLEHPDKVTQTSASAAGDSHGESSNTSVTTDADLSEKRHRVNSSTDEITLEDWIKRENFLSYIFPKSTDITAARQAIKDALHAGPNFDSKLVYSVISSCSEQDKVHVLRKVRYLVKICCKVTFRDAFQKRCLLKYASEHISEIVEVPSDHEEVEFVEDLLKRLVNEEVRLYRLSEEYHGMSSLNYSMDCCLRT